MNLQDVFLTVKHIKKYLEKTAENVVEQNKQLRSK